MEPEDPHMLVEITAKFTYRVPAHAAARARARLEAAPKDDVLAKAIDSFLEPGDEDFAVVEDLSFYFRGEEGRDLTEDEFHSLLED